MQLPVEAVAATVLIEVVRISALPIEQGVPQSPYAPCTAPQGCHTSLEGT
ncbi:hypothetical protein ACFVYE_35345 [Streptomyces sp. NPDC058239]